MCSSPLQQPSLFLSETEKRRPWLCCLAATLTQWFCIITLTRQFSQSHVSAAFCPLHKRSIHCLRLSHMVECSGVAPEETSSHFHAAFKFLFALKATELPPWLPFWAEFPGWHVQYINSALGYVWKCTFCAAQQRKKRKLSFIGAL